MVSSLKRSSAKDRTILSKYHRVPSPCPPSSCPKLMVHRVMAIILQRKQFIRINHLLLFPQFCQIGSHRTRRPYPCRYQKEAPGLFETPLTSACRTLRHTISRTSPRAWKKILQRRQISRISSTIGRRCMVPSTVWTRLTWCHHRRSPAPSRHLPQRKNRRVSRMTWRTLYVND